MKIEGFSIRPTDPARALLTWRCYATREGFRRPSGESRPLPGTWELLWEVRLGLRRGRLTFPAFDLEPTREGGALFYNLVPVDGRGREVWHPGEDLVLPAELPEILGRPPDLVRWVLYNLELRGEIAPGQLRD